MTEQSTTPSTESRPSWDTLEEWMRGQMQTLIQRVLEDEVTEFVGRAKSQRRGTVRKKGRKKGTDLFLVRGHEAGRACTYGQERRSIDGLGSDRIARAWS